MNNILTLRGNPFKQEKRGKMNVSVSIPKNSIITLSKLKEVHLSLTQAKEYWDNNNIIDGVLISVYYDRIVAKSNRLQGYFKGSKGLTPNDTIVGAKFNDTKKKHIITHYISREVLDTTISISAGVIKLFEMSFPEGELNQEQFADDKLFTTLDYDRFGFPKTTFRKFLRDSCFVESFGIEEAEKENLKNSIITFYNVSDDISAVLKRLNIEVTSTNILDQTTVLLDEKNVELLFLKAPYLVSMAVEDFTKLSEDDFKSTLESVDMLIPSPTTEPVIGVIDTLFERNVYFSEWVEYHDMVSDDITKEVSDYRHGTAVTSLIVDGPNLNKDLDDGCGRFQVRHFGVSLHSGFNSFSIIQQIKEIVSQNLDIKVWNLSLGSNDEIKDNFISAEAAVLDDIQFEYDVIFVIAGTNAVPSQRVKKKIGAPADSLNSVIVNSVDFDNKPADYSREGTILSFFIKPDIAYYGGGSGRCINVWEPFGMARVTGTSYASPLVARKLAYLIHIMGLRREEAKALLIDSAIGWNDRKTFEELTLIGNGVVPVKMEDILTSAEDEIKFIVSDVSEKYSSFNYNFPVPIWETKYPYVAKATMCYFPRCSRNQGVDYTNTELNLVFGRLSDGKKAIEPINQDNQNMDDAPGYVKEGSARDLFRKWDNTKHIAESFTPRKRAKPILNEVNPQWGMCVKTIERLKKRDGQGIRFGVVVTLKEINGVNRIEDFINQSLLRGWLVNELRIETQVDIYNSLTEEIEFE